MLFSVDERARTAEEINATSFGELAVKERLDIQEWVIACPRLLGEDLLLVTDEFDQFDRTSERLDVLAVDRSGKLVVVELKRTAVGTRADLQALRYAAYCSTLSLDDIAELYAVWRRGTEGDLSVEDARAEIREFVEDPDFDEFDDQPRIVIAAEEFPPEMMATILWATIVRDGHLGRTAPALPRRCAPARGFVGPDPLARGRRIHHSA